MSNSVNHTSEEKTITNTAGFNISEEDSLRDRIFSALM